jgi:hypothetical protein
VPPGSFGLAALAAVVGGLTAFGSTAFLTWYFRRHDAWSFNPFVYYCSAIGAVPAIYLTFA